jgi:hypothetical protein
MVIQKGTERQRIASPGSCGKASLDEPGGIFASTDSCALAKRKSVSNLAAADEQGVQGPMEGGIAKNDDKGNAVFTQESTGKALGVCAI